MALSWGTKKQLTYFSIIFGIFIISVLILVWPYFNKQPTCFDGKQNGDESGVDCGGSCLLVCTAEAYRLVPLWAQAFEVADGVYNLMAYVENQNRESGIIKIGYEFRVYDENNIFIGRINGSTFISSNDRTAIFESGFLADNRIPSRVDFNFTEIPVWVKINREQRNSLALSAEDRVLANTFEKPRLSAKIKNNTLIEMRNLDVYAILYDENENVMNVSKTLIENLPKNGRSDVFFTWPKPFEKSPSRIDIFPQVNIFSLGL